MLLLIQMEVQFKCINRAGSKAKALEQGHGVAAVAQEDHYHKQTADPDRASPEVTAGQGRDAAIFQTGGPLRGSELGCWQTEDLQRHEKI